MNFAVLYQRSKLETLSAFVTKQSTLLGRKKKDICKHYKYAISYITLIGKRIRTKNWRDIRLNSKIRKPTS